MTSFARSSRLVAALALCVAAPCVSADEWGTIKGRFVFGGDAPAASELKADKDPDVCGKHKLVAEELVVGGDKGIANIVVYVRTENIAINPEAAEKAKASVVLDNKDCRFEPHVVVVQTGQELEIKNSDPVGHNVNVACLKNSPFNQIVPAGQSIKTSFKSEEPRPVQAACNIHPWMKGYIVVRPNPYAAVSAKDGSFEIAGVPAGELELVMIHEKAGYIQNFKVEGKPEEAKKGRKKVVVKANETFDLGDMVIDASVFAK
jgi:plastocyanin